MVGLEKKRRARAVALRDQLEQDILVGRYRPGERLDETSLATRFKVSRTPVREALLQLAAIGIVAQRPRRGAYVADMSPLALANMFEMMAELEASCARLAALRITRQARHSLQDAHQACAEAADSGDEDAYYYENERFHHIIYEASANAFLAEQTRQLRNRLKPYRRLQLRAKDRISGSLSEHRGIVDAILSGRSLQAGELIRSHILVQRELLGQVPVR